MTFDLSQSECLSLVGSLYGALADPVRFRGVRSACERWLDRHDGPDTPAVAFLRTQLPHAEAAALLASGGATPMPSACAVVAIDDGGRVLAAGAEAWTLLRSGTPGQDALRLPGALRTFGEDACLGTSVPLAVRVPLDDADGELVGIVLGMDVVMHAVGSMRVITLLLCDVASAPAATSATRRRADVREFRRRTATAQPRITDCGLRVTS